MKKLLLPFEGNHYPQDLLDFVATLQPVSASLLTAAFVPESDYAGMLQVEQCQAIGETPCYGKDEERMVNYNSRKLERFCEEFDIKLKIHLDQEDFALPCLRRESRYADLMLMSGRHFFGDIDKDQPNAWMKDILHRSECPVLLLPDKSALPGELILTYDGSASSVYAIRQFAYLFPEFCRVPATLVYVNDDPQAKIPDEAEIRELGNMHFAKFRVLKLPMKSAEFYNTWMGMMRNPWLITGSFGRSAFSQLFVESFSTGLILQHRMPVFVAHK
jgi:hypothetical protein